MSFVSFPTERFVIPFILILEKTNLLPFHTVTLRQCWRWWWMWCVGNQLMVLWFRISGNGLSPAFSLTPLVLTCGKHPSSGSISSARGLASPARPSQCSPTGANVSGFESSPFWRWLAPNPWQILSKISDAACLFYPGSLCGCAGLE